MLTSKQWGTIDEYLKLDISITEIAKRIGISKPTIYKRKKILKQGQSLVSERITEKESKIFKYLPYIKRALKRNITSSRVIYTILKDIGCKYSYWTINREIKKIKARKKEHYKPSIRRETGPGEEAQMDWGYYGEIFMDVEKRKVWFFVFVLGYSRCIYIQFTVSQNRQTLKQCHINAFKKLGIPHTIVYDNMKTVVKKRIKLNGEKHVIPSSEFLDFARCLGFEIFACAPYHPRSKGKVEAVVKFVKKNFIQHLQYQYKKNKITLELLNQEVQKWTEEQHERIHDETHEKPNDLWNEEKHYLHFPDIAKLATLLTPMVIRRSSKDGYIFYKNFAPFQLPPQYAEVDVGIKEINENGISYIEVYFKSKVIAKYLLSNTKNHVNLLTQKQEKIQRVGKKNKKNRRGSQLKGTSSIPKDGFYRPGRYYDKFTSYHSVLWEKK